MRLTHIQAHDFLSFCEFSLDGLDPRLNVIVGPNGAGKSNVVRTVHLVSLALTWASGREPGERVREYAGAVRRGANAERFCVRVGIELDQQRERAMLIAWLRAALLSTFAAANQPRGESTNTYLLQAVDEKSVEVFTRGSVVVAFQHLPAERFYVGYEFEVDEQTYCYVMRGDRQGSIVRGRLDDQLPRGGPTRSRDLLLVEEEIGNSSEPDIPFDFNADRLLPGNGQFIELSVQLLYNWQETDTVREFMRIFGFGVENRVYMLDVVLARLFAEITIVNECRGVAHHRYPTGALTAPAEPYQAGEVPLELLRLKLGTLEQRQRFQRTRELFQTLTNVEFDLCLQRVAESSENGTPAGELEFQIDVDVIDGGTAIPLAFSGAGRWEALVLCTALTGDGTVTILDEPAVNLHPTLQRRLLQAIREGLSQALVITHSPFLVPADGRTEIERVIRVTRDDGRSAIHRASFDQTLGRKADRDAFKLQQFMLGSSDVRSLLFATAVLLVEGDTELGALDIWLPPVKSEKGVPSPNELNLVIAPVDGDANFGGYVSYLDMFGVPWAILCDGKVLSARDPKALAKQFAAKLTGQLPSEDAGFATCRDYWATQGVFTLAESFDEEIEVVLQRCDPQAWDEVVARYKRSKVRAGRAFAERAAPPERLGSIYAQLLGRLGLTDTRSSKGGTTPTSPI